MRHLRSLLVVAWGLAALVVSGAGPAAVGSTAVPVTITSASVLPGQSTTVSLQALGASPSVGAATLDVTYAPAVLSVTACAADPGGVFDFAACNTTFTANTIRFVGISASGVSGNVTLADLTFQAVGSPGQVSPLHLTVVTFADVNGFDILTSAQDGSIEIQEPDTDQDGVADSVDNCPDDANPGQANGDGDQWGDACDECPAYFTAWMVEPGDGDCDGFTDADEGMIGTDAADPCADDAADDAWPADFDNNRVINVLDVGKVLPPYFGTTVPPTSPRRDLVPSGFINILDVGMTLPPFFGESCT